MPVDARKQAFAPSRVPCAAPAAPLVAAPVRLADCPTCDAKAGERCAGFRRWDECHIDRLAACP